MKLSMLEIQCQEVCVWDECKNDGRVFEIHL